MNPWYRKPEEIRALAKNHWNYIEGILKVHGEDDDTLQKLRYHYIESMIHGYKHAIEDWELS